MLTQKLQSETTNAVTKPINSYPVEKQGMIKSFLNSVDNGLNDFVERVKNGSKKFERYKISEVSAREADDIKNLLGIDVKGYTHNINSDGIRHILKRHGVDGQQNSTMSKDNDIARIGWVIKNYDSVELLTKDGESGTSAGFKDKFGKPAPQIRYSKKINGTYYVVEAVFENDYNKLWVQSAYLKKDKEGVTQVPAESKNTNHVAYARSEFASPPSINSLSQGGEKVNKDYIAKEASSQEENASFFDDYNSEKRVPPINPDEVIEGFWEDSPNSSKNSKIENVEKSQLETFDNNNEAWYNKNDIITDGSHLVNGKLKPNVKYKSGEYNYIYETDEFGNIARVHVEELKHTERKYRKRHKQNTSGKQVGDHAGHLIADRFGGSAELDNLVSQSAFVNLSEYKKLENIWDNAIKNGQKVSFDMQIKYDKNSSRPSEFIVEYSINGRNDKKAIKN